jgi:hypothetical protein
MRSFNSGFRVLSYEISSKAMQPMETVQVAYALFVWSFIWDWVRLGNSSDASKL